MGGRKCCVPNCKSNYSSTSGYVSVFRFPKESKLKSQWVQRIGRNKFIPNNNTVVCIKHFEKDCIITHDILPRPDGDIKILRGIPKLKDGAYPTIFEECSENLSTVEQSVGPTRRINEVKQLDAYFQAWMNANHIEDSGELLNEVVSESDFVEKEPDSSYNQKEKKHSSRLVEDFVIPALNNKTYGDLLKWDPHDPSCFLLSWTHKAASVWNLDHAAVFAAWDEIKGRPAPKNRLDFVDSKQRMRAALKAVRNVEVVKGGGGYRRYKILNLDEYEVLQDDALDFPIDGDENVADNTQNVCRKPFFDDYSSASSPEPPENERKKQHSLEKQTASEVTPYHRHTRSLTQKIIEICPESQSSLFEEYDEMPKQRKKNPSKRSANEAFEEDILKIQSCETLAEKNEPKEEDTIPKKELPQNLKKRKRRIRRFSPKKKPPSKNLRKWKRPKKVFKLNLNEFPFKKRKICQKSTIPLQYSVLENQSLYWNTMDQIATHVKQEPLDHYPADTTENEENNQVVPESSITVSNHIIKQEPIEYESEASFRLEDSDNDSENEMKPDSPASEPENLENAERETHKPGHSLIADFIVPALDNETYGDLLLWDPYDPSVFLIKWMHKASASWSSNEAAVFIAWDVFKGRPAPETREDFVGAKQRLRSAFRNLKSVQFVEEQNGYRGYRILGFPGAESNGERKSTAQKPDVGNSVNKRPSCARPKLKDHLKRKKKHFSSSNTRKAKSKSSTSPKSNSSATPKLNSSELLGSYQHHTRSLTRKMDEICPSPKSTFSDRSNENSMEPKESTLGKSTLEKDEHIVQSSKFSKAHDNEHQKPVLENNLSDTLTKTKSGDRYNDTGQTVTDRHPGTTIKFCSICQRPAESACFYCCVINYCSTECAECPANRSHYESCKDEYLFKLNVVKARRSIAENQPCL